MRILVTGADGFVGQHVLAGLLDRRHDVVGGITGDEPALTTLSPAPAERVQWVSFDLRDEHSVRSLVDRARPDAVLHLAGITSVSQSWSDPGRTFEVNVQGATHLLLALRALPAGESRRPIVLVGSGEAYGQNGTEEDPLTEDVPLRPLSPYAASKAAQEMLGWAMGRATGLRLVHTRSFQQMGPGQRAAFVTVDWATQLLAVRDGRQDPVLHVGNIDVVRDFLDVRDAADAYIRLLEDDRAEGVFNVCSGRGVSLHSLLQALQSATGVEVDVQVDPERLRPADLSSFVGDPSRLAAAVDWQPRRPLDRTLDDLIAHLVARGADAS